jgi:prevent-host-death family protein
MSAEVSLRELRSDLDALLERVNEGEKIVITRGGRPVAYLEPHQGQDPSWPAEQAKLREETTEDFGPFR